MNKILITGAKGYIGSYLCVLLVGLGFDVIGFNDDLNKTEKLPDCDLIIHCAGRRWKEGISINDLIYSNVTANQNLARLAKGIPIIYISTAAVYVIRLDYGLTKLLGEHILNELHGNTISLRLQKVVEGYTKDEEGSITIGIINVGEKILEIINSLSVKN